MIGSELKPSEGASPERFPAEPMKPRMSQAAMVVGALGVVYGDIGTSPLYAFQASLQHFPAGRMTHGAVLGVLSLIFWALFLIVTVKYVLVVMRADNRGEGGILSLMALAQRVAGSPGTRRMLGIVGVLGACLVFGDGVITPAISILSAIEGVEVSEPGLTQFVLPVAIVIIFMLFAFQSRGTGGVGKLFGPIMVLWFLAIGLLGLNEIVHHPVILLALSPSFGVRLLLENRLLGFEVLGSVVLAVTGAEALYADMGHFGVRPIRLAWLFFVLPSLVLNYFGQGALILHDPKAVANPFYLLGPPWAQIPMVVLATAAGVIASQALISGAFSMARQCVQLGYFPRLVVRHTSDIEGQIFVPQVNTALMIGVTVLVLAFRTSAALGAAYGIAVTGTFLCTCVLAGIVFRRHFGWSRWMALGVFGGFFVIDGIFFAANTLRIVDGGWVPLALAAGLMGLMTSWHRGRELMLARWKQDSMPLALFLGRLPQSRTLRVPGIAVFMTGNPDYVPNALLHNLKHNKVLHERVIFVTVNNIDEPEVSREQRATVEELAAGVYRVVLRYGFQESPNIPADLAALRNRGVPFEPMQVSYFLGRETIVPSLQPRMPFWRLWLFLVMARNAVSATEFFRIPSDRVVELGVRVAI